MKNWPESRIDYLKFSELTATVFRGCRTYTKRTVLRAQNRESLKGELPVNQLPLPFTHEQRDVTAVLQNWRVNQRQRPSASSATLWMAQDLSTHLNLPVNSPRPPGILQQVFFMEVGLPGFLMTVCASDLDKAAEDDIHRYAVGLLKQHSRTMKDFCSHPFVILPLTIQSKNLSSEGVEKGIQEQVATASVYRGPFHVSQSAYDSLKDGMEAVSAGTMMPCFLHDSSAESEWLLQCPGEWRKFLHFLIEFIRKGSGQVQHACCYEPYQAVKILFLEAIRRVSFSERVEVCTGDTIMSQCIKKSMEHSRETMGIEEKWVCSESHSKDSCVTVTLFQNVITFKRHFRASAASREEEASFRDGEERGSASLNIINNEILVHSNPDNKRGLNLLDSERHLQKARKRIELALLSNSKIEDTPSRIRETQQALFQSYAKPKSIAIVSTDEQDFQRHRARKTELTLGRTIAKDKSRLKQNSTRSMLTGQRINRLMEQKTKDRLIRTIPEDKSRPKQKSTRPLLTEEQDMNKHVAPKTKLGRAVADEEVLAMSKQKSSRLLSNDRREVKGHVTTVAAEELLPPSGLTSDSRWPLSTDELEIPAKQGVEAWAGGDTVLWWIQALRREVDRDLSTMHDIQRHGVYTAAMTEGGANSSSAPELTSLLNDVPYSLTDPWLCLKQDGDALRSRLDSRTQMEQNPSPLPKAVQSPDGYPIGAAHKKLKAGKGDNSARRTAMALPTIRLEVPSMNCAPIKEHSASQESDIIRACA